jgi:hypothetical protein
VVADGGTVPVDDWGADDSTVVVQAVTPRSKNAAVNVLKSKLRSRFMEPLGS